MHLFSHFILFWWWDYKTALQAELWGLLFLSQSFKAFTVQVTFFPLTLFHNVYIYINCSEQNVQIYNFNFERGKRWIAANKYYAYAHDHCFKWQRKNHLLPDKKHIPVITLSITFRHHPPSSARIGYATHWGHSMCSCALALFAPAKCFGTKKTGLNILKHPCKHKAQSPCVKNKFHFSSNSYGSIW